MMSEEKKIYFQNQKTIIDFLSKGEKILSDLHVGEIPSMTPTILESKNYNRIFSTGWLVNGAELFKEIVYEHPSGFYIYFSKGDYSEQNYQIKMIYTPEKHKEIIMFINQIKNFKK